ncbi:unnamed protein product [Darwinula stevensoni]|uniref:Uncharacterized protein n=1 Tax=Darwinula stevensoni TaxID=69355 RepID=A0A7R8X9V9_9CRUS|nr:unnamed protein product [Darwinula stevensoni]CAG0882953.1 unnamed protein product [Darwinula stevensoni]
MHQKGPFVKQSMAEIERGNKVLKSNFQGKQQSNYFYFSKDIDMEDGFSYVGIKEDSCKHKIICHMHRIVPTLPNSIIQLYQLISKRLKNAEKYEEPIELGLQNGDCDKIYYNCTDYLAPNVLRQHVDFNLDLVCPFDLTYLGSGSLSRLPILTIPALILVFFFIYGLFAIPVGFITEAAVSPITKGKRSVEDDPILRWSNLLSRLDMEDGFSYVGIKEDSCKHKIICHMHRIVPTLPNSIIQLYQLISKRLKNAEKYEEPIELGLQNGDCDKIYYNCTESVSSLSKGAIGRPASAASGSPVRMCRSTRTLWDEEMDTVVCIGLPIPVSVLFTLNFTCEDEQPIMGSIVLGLNQFPVLEFDATDVAHTIQNLLYGVCIVYMFWHMLLPIVALSLKEVFCVFETADCRDRFRIGDPTPEFDEFFVFNPDKTNELNIRGRKRRKKRRRRSISFYYSHPHRNEVRGEYGIHS